MKRFLVAITAGIVMTCTTLLSDAQSLNRSPSLKLGGGVGAPVGDSADGAATIGLSLIGGISVPLVGNAHAILEGFHTNIGPDEATKLDLEFIGVKDANVKLTGGNMGLMVRSNPSPVGVYGLAGIGLTRVTGNASALGITVSDTESTLSFAVGTGIQVSFSSSISLLVDVRYNHGLDAFDQQVQWIPITTAIVFRL